MVRRITSGRKLETRARERAAQRRQAQAIEEAAMQAAEPTIIPARYGGSGNLLYA